MLPEATNRVTLSGTHKDSLGFPLMTVHYDVNDYVRAAGEVVKQDYDNFQKLFGATVFSKNTTEWENRDHPMGTVSMGSDASDSVVNHECRTFDHDNLFLVTTGVMPAAAANNPTMTGCALSLRAAAIIAKEV